MTASPCYRSTGHTAFTALNAAPGSEEHLKDAVAPPLSGRERTCGGRWDLACSTVTNDADTTGRSARLAGTPVPSEHEPRESAHTNVGARPRSSLDAAACEPALAAPLGFPPQAWRVLGLDRPRSAHRRALGRLPAPRISRRQGWQLGSSERIVLPDPVESVERESDDRVTVLRLVPPA